MTDFASSLTRTIARQYDLFQASLEFLQKDRKFLNYGYTVSGKETYEERQERLCLEVFQAAEIGQGDVVIDVGFGSGEQDFLLSNTCEFSRLIGFNISELQVRYANERATGERGSQAFVSPGRSRAASRRRRLIRGQDPGDRVRVLLRSAALLPASGAGLETGRPGGSGRYRLRRSCRVPGAKGRGPATGRHAIVKPYRMGEGFPHTIRVPHQ
jgi:hypothetical protein